MKTLDELLQEAKELKGSDVFILPMSQVRVKCSGKMVPVTEEKVRLTDIGPLVDRAYELANRNQKNLDRDGDDDFSFAIPGISRFRCNVYRQRGTLALVLRVVAFGLPDPKERHIPDQVMKLAELRSGMVLVTGPAGSGKSTTLACIVDEIDRSREPVGREQLVEHGHGDGQALRAAGGAVLLAEAERLAVIGFRHK